LTSCARRTRTPEQETKDTHIAPVLPECARGEDE
jgi:hypothetical protein